MVQANLDMTDSMGPGKLVRHMHGTGTKHIVSHRQKSDVQVRIPGSHALNKAPCLKHFPTVN